MSESWSRCFTNGRGCMERFLGKTKQDSLRLLESHFVTTPQGRQCMGQSQLKLSFKWDEKNGGWVAK